MESKGQSGSSDGRSSGGLSWERGSNWNKIPGTKPEFCVQKGAVLGTAKILCRTFKLPGSEMEEDICPP